LIFKGELNSFGFDNGVLSQSFGRSSLPSGESKMGMDCNDDDEQNDFYFYG